jgi:hypothetical protein
LRRVAGPESLALDSDGHVVSVVGEERSALLVNRWNIILLACPSGHGDDNGQDEEDCHDGKGKDPLEGHDLAMELSHSDGGRQDTETEAHGVVLGKPKSTNLSCIRGSKRN